MILVVADDLSGAAELAGLAHLGGLSAEVQTRFDPTSKADVIALDAATRSIGTTQAIQKVRSIGIQAAVGGAEWIYQKTDSVLRGHIRAELTALMEVTRSSRALLIPANPKRGRIIENGHYLVQGTPLDKTVFATDPEYPAFADSVERLLRREDGAEVHSLRKNEEIPASGIAVPDITTPGDLIDRARAIQPGTALAGAAEFFGAVLSFRAKWIPGEPRVPKVEGPGIQLLVCGSAAAWPERRRQCQSFGVPVVILDPIILEAARECEVSGEVSRWVDQAAAVLGNRASGALALGDPGEEYIKSPVYLAKALAWATELVLARVPVNCLLLEGGATAAAVLDRTKWCRLEVMGHFAPDLATLRAVQDRHQRLVVIKPGSYPWPERIWR